MCNAFVGMMGKRYLKDDKAFLTTDFETVQAILCMYPEGFRVNLLHELIVLPVTDIKEQLLKKNTTFMMCLR